MTPPRNLTPCPSDLCSLQFRADRQTPVAAHAGTQTLMGCILTKENIERGKTEKEITFTWTILHRETKKITLYPAFFVLLPGQKAMAALPVPPPKQSHSK